MAKEIFQFNHELTDEERIFLAIENPGATFLLLNDEQQNNEELQMASITRSVSSAQYIKNPTINVQEFLVKRNPVNIKYIHNPDKTVLDDLLDRLLKNKKTENNIRALKILKDIITEPEKKLLIEVILT